MIISRRFLGKDLSMIIFLSSYVWKVNSKSTEIAHDWQLYIHRLNVETTERSKNTFYELNSIITVIVRGMGPLLCSFCSHKIMLVRHTKSWRYIVNGCLFIIRFFLSFSRPCGLVLYGTGKGRGGGYSERRSGGRYSRNSMPPVLMIAASATAENAANNSVAAAAACIVRPSVGFSCICVINMSLPVLAVR